MVVLKVHMDCSGCANKVRKALEKLDGVDEVDIDMEMKKVTVTGWAEEKKLLEAVRKTGRRAEPWPMPYNPNIHNFRHYYDQHESFLSTSNPTQNNANFFFKNRRVVNQYTYDPDTVFNEEGNDIAIFSDDNPHACSVV
ncbi:hypothetical protein Nepgr_007346 [Nepenthes gracilis]|uniref:HMA domain-containing protein n=1 Tax=Nepenthes gracilis TaxID=150966 RepID=A0AAD3XIE8_NEPGR|nr:hypothetical protein Nepgr_007346 [Nepenthes gracilis]